MAKKSEKEERNFRPFLEFVKRDFVYIILLLVAVLGCMYTLYNVGDYQQQCNEHWIEQMNMGNCICQGYGGNATSRYPLFEDNFTLKTPFVEELKT
jgi:hypothetical protein